MSPQYHYVQNLNLERSPVDIIEVPAADDRTKDEPDDPGFPVDLKSIQNLWRDRDVWYAKSDRKLTEAQIEVIREGRKRETGYLPPKYRARAWAIANSWYPPQHGQGAMQ